MLIDNKNLRQKWWSKFGWQKNTTSLMRKVENLPHKNSDG
jgi:ABC-type antimicrobial peptide transport system ATPase subunit